MDNMFIIKSGDLRYRLMSGCKGVGTDFSPKTQLKSAHKMAKKDTAQRVIEEHVRMYTRRVEDMARAMPRTGYTAEHIAQDLAHEREQLALWQAARVVEVKLVEE